MPLVGASNLDVARQRVAARRDPKRLLLGVTERARDRRPTRLRDGGVRGVENGHAGSLPDSAASPTSSARIGFYGLPDEVPDEIGEPCNERIPR